MVAQIARRDQHQNISGNNLKYNLPPPHPTHLKNLANVELETLIQKNYAELSAALSYICVMADSDWVLDTTTPPIEMFGRFQTKLLASIRVSNRTSIPETLRA